MTSSPPKRMRDAPPNYFSRSMQIRLLAATASLMLVLVLMLEARKPENWAWMWAGTVTESKGTDQIDTRLRVPPPQPPGVVQGPARLRAGPSDDPNNEPQARLLGEAWAFVLSELPREDREVIAATLYAARAGQAVLPAELSKLEPALSRVDRRWQRYFSHARDALERDSSTQGRSERWLAAISSAEIEWPQRWRPALRAALDASPWRPAAVAALHDLQRVDDGVALASVRDDTVSRYEERHIWFRLFERLQHAEPQELRRQSLGEIGFLQLFRQPDIYRGRIVTVRGSVRLAYQVAAPKNLQGIEHYYVFWLKPAGGQLSPFIVYALQLPPGFPPLGDRQSSQTSAPPAAELVVTGYFFKRRAYRAQDGVNTAPVLLAKVPRWIPSSSAKPTAAPAVGFAVSIIVLVALLSIVLARLTTSRDRQRIRLPSAARRAADGVDALAGSPLTPPVGDRLRALSLADQARSSADQALDSEN